MGRYRDTGIVDDNRHSGRPKDTTAVGDLYLQISARRNPESNIIMLNNDFRAAIGRRIRLKLFEIGCMMRNFTPDVHGEVHIWYLDTMQRGTDGPKNTLNGLVIIGIKLYSQTIVRDVFGGSLVKLSVSDTLSSKCSKVVVP